jgi:hypothetical protein
LVISLSHTPGRSTISGISRQRKPALRVAFKGLFKGLRDFPLIATAKHRFWARDGWRCLSDLVPIPQIRGRILWTIAMRI